MILYRKGIVSDDPEVKMEDDTGVKKEIVEGEFGVSGQDEYGYESSKDVKLFIKRQNMDNSTLRFDGNPGTRDPNVSLVPYTGTVASLGIPLGVPLEISCEPLASKCRGGTAFDFSSRGAVPLERESSGYQNHNHPTPKIRAQKTERLAHGSEPVEFFEISPASKKDPIVIDDDGHGDVYGV